MDNGMINRCVIVRCRDAGVNSVRHRAQDSLNGAGVRSLACLHFRSRWP